MAVLPKRSIGRPDMSSYQVFALVTNILTIVILIVVFIIFEKKMEPFNRGFYCDDHSIMKPYKVETISGGLAAILALIFVVVAVLGCDCLNRLFSNKKQEEDRKCNMPKWIYVFLMLTPLSELSFPKSSRKISIKLPKCKNANLEMLRGEIKAKAYFYYLTDRRWIHRILINLLLFFLHRMFGRMFVLGLVGLALCMNLIDVTKIMVGRLRPHFIDVCKPDLSNCTLNSKFMEFSACTVQSGKAFKESRKSFPSGHSGSAGYATIFFALYIEYAMRSTKHVILLKPLVQFFLNLGGVAVCLTRISDSFHHWSDMLAGYLIGLLCASYVIFKLIQLAKEMRGQPTTNQVKSKDDDGELTCITTGGITNYQAADE